MKTYTKDPAATLDYAIDWSARLAPSETIAASAWFIAAQGASTNTLAIEGTPVSAAGKNTVFLRGGAAGERYLVTNRITTNSSPVARVDERSFIVAIVNT